ncbi:MAG: hypothetical protein R2795_11815 [Saprospiraceae bacterium]
MLINTSLARSDLFGAGMETGAMPQLCEGVAMSGQPDAATAQPARQPP